MNTERPLERKVICSVERAYSNSESDVGKLRAYYEILPSNEIVQINSIELFCETERVFVTGQFTELKEKFGDRLFEVTCIPSSFEAREGDCKYVTRFTSCTDIKGLVCCQIYDHPLPSVASPEFITNKKPVTKNIVLRNASKLYGPFEYLCDTDNNLDSYQIQIKAISTPLNNTLPFHIGEIKADEWSSYIFEKPGLPTLLGNIKKCFEHSESIDYITDDQIISVYGSKIAQNSEIRSFNKGTIAQIRKSFAASVEQKKYPDRFRRLFEALDNANNWEGTRKELIDNFLLTQSGRNILEEYIETNKEVFFKDEKQAFLKKLESTHVQLKNDIQELTSKKDKIEGEIRKSLREREEMELNAESTLSIDTLSKKQKEVLDNAIAEKKLILDGLSNQVESLQRKHSRFNTLEAIEQEIKELDRDKERAQGRLNEMNSQVEDVATKLRSSNEQLTTRLLELKPHVDALSGIAPKPQATQISYHVPVKALALNTQDDDLREDLIDGVLESLNSLGRKTDYNSVANILTTIAQTQFTLFSGRPGTGKTSLAKMLGVTLGLKNRMLNIPVARGWTSSRDVLGFYNSLSSSFNSSATGLYEFLTQLHSETKSTAEAAPAICLLDEFNLSQPEHYFSPFLEMADPESKRIITTGDQTSPFLEIPKYLRFLGTINNDESVQSLTPRMLDRSAIISFDDFELDYDISLSPVKSLDDLDVTAISGNKFIEIFTPRSLELPQDIDRTLRLIIDTLREEKPEFGPSISVSFRKIKAIRAYHSVTSSMYIDSRFAALDYAVCQHIIPLLNGYGQNFGKRLMQLSYVIPDEMELTHKMLKRIIDIGNQNMFTYGFNI
ncbi:PhoH family protein [Aeromonas caviae]|uniref:PhoH family protein n=1 Tax=Aeromonas caviae TaxID=648 RepID=UPI001CC48DC0|nr:PhoH family protein [Aeromonas caviae]GJA95505.1 ATPase AAA [Aeromonas caviae]